MYACLFMIAATLLAPASQPSDPQEAAYTQAIDKRADEALANLNLSDPVKAARVHEDIVAQYRALRAWHDANDPKIAAKQDVEAVEASRKSLHEGYLANLAKELTPEQITIVKDYMTYGTVKVTYDAYCDEVPQLTEQQKAHIHDLLTQARDEAMDGGSQKEKAAIFKKYKGKINIYLAAQGYDMKKLEKEWQQRLKAKRTTQPGN